MLKKVCLLLSLSSVLTGCIPLEDSCFDGLFVNLTVENNSERVIQVYSYGQTNGKYISITTNEQDDQLAEIMGLTARPLFSENNEEEKIHMGSLKKGLVSSFLVEVKFDDGRSTKFAGWPQKYQTLPDIAQYGLGYVRSSKNVLVSSFPQKGAEVCMMDMDIVVDTDESVEIRKG